MFHLTAIIILTAGITSCFAVPASRHIESTSGALPPGQQFPGGVDTSSGQLASTTSYTISEGDQNTACGCSGTWQAPNGGTVLTAAASFPIYGDGYCGSGCGQCFELEDTGNPPCPDSGYQGCGAGGHAGEKVIIMVTNSCPNDQGNQEWCSSPNEHGYSYHFDIAVPVGAVNAQNDWGNAEVRFVPVDCNIATGAPGSNMQGDLLTNYGQCQCAAAKSTMNSASGSVVSAPVVVQGQ